MYAEKRAWPAMINRPDQAKAASEKLAEKKNSRSMLSESEKLPHLTEPANTQDARKRTLAVNWL
jgi:hypothetical protein